MAWAGLECTAFKALFPEWTVREDIKEINLQVSLHSKYICYDDFNTITIFFLGWPHR